MEQKRAEDLYVGGMLYKDVCDFCGNFDVVAKVRAAAQRKIVYHVPAMLLTTGWMAYYGMIKAAIILDMVRWGITTILPNQWLKLGINVIWMLLFGLMAIPFYYVHIRKKMDVRGLLMRSEVESEKLSQSLAKEGNASFKRFLLYVVFRFLTIQVLNGIVFTIQVKFF